MDLNNKDTKVSYSLGLSVANNLLTAKVHGLEIETFTEALEAALTGAETKLSTEDANKILQEYFGEIQQAEAEKCSKEGATFLAENAKKEGVVTLPSGLQYKILTEGNGAKPTAEQQVKCHYHGTLIDGTVFDSSVNRGEPATFPVNGVIPGWVEALQLMPIGSKWELYVPSNLAYGERGAGDQIPPHTTLVFQVELLEII